MPNLTMVHATFFLPPLFLQGKFGSPQFSSSTIMRKRMNGKVKEVLEAELGATVVLI